MDFGRFFADPILEDATVSNLFSIFVLSAFKTRRRYMKLSRAKSTGIDRPVLYTLTPDRPPLAACTGMSWCKRICVEIEGSQEGRDSCNGCEDDGSLL